MTTKILEEYYILGNKISIKELNGNTLYEVEEVKLTDKEKEILKNINEKNIKYDNLDPTTADRILYSMKKQQFGRITILLLDDKITEITCFNYNMPLYVSLRGYGVALTNLKYSYKEEIISDLQKIFSSAIRHKNQLILENDEMRGIVNVSNPEKIAFNISKKDKKVTSITNLINSRLISRNQASLLWELLENNAFIIFVGNIKISSKILESIINLTSNFKILNIRSKPILNMINEKCINIDSRDIENEDIDLYNPDIVIFDKLNKNILTESLKLSAYNKGIIILSDFPDHYSLLNYLDKNTLLSLSKLPTIIVENLRSKTSFYEIYSIRNKIKVLKISNIKSIKDIKRLYIYAQLHITDENVSLKEKILNELAKNNITDYFTIFDKLKEVKETNAVTFN
ncbi:hypothetical protein [Acidianus manzaensis]|uniref:Uncharacterized protein n=1 Tax=Acidianus manzaensis TaxID=282676 RepID=A0A1W6JZP0_9CREN|nr:hypothetical protein [Acidianus manzaensis]ARM75728.1 hypothetical protein B6F84_06530 [Acidianus manzaensis]